MDTQYPHIENVYSRDLITNKLTGEYKIPEFKLLENIEWIATEKVDGTNIRIMWIDGKLTFNGKTDNAQIHGDLVKKILEVLKDKESMCIEKFGNKSVVIYCEGYGAGIQKGSGYSKTKELIAYDVNIDGYWLDRGNVVGIAELFGIRTVPIVLRGNLKEIVEYTKNGFQSIIAEDVNTIAEGVVVRPALELKGKYGRLICKIKTKDFK